MAELRFRSRGLRALHERGDRSRVDPRYVNRVLQVLAAMDRATSVEDLRLASFRLHRLHGDMVGMWSIRVSANWRIIFRADGATLYDIDYVDYHRR